MKKKIKYLIETFQENRDMRKERYNMVVGTHIDRL